MYEGLNKIFWGIFIATFNINLGPIKILPGFIGFIMIANGVNLINNEHKSEIFNKANDFARIAIVISLLGELINFFSGGSLDNLLIMQIWSIVFMVIELLIFYKLFEGIIEHFNLGKNLELAERYVDNIRTYVIISIINISAFSFIMLFNLTTLNTISALVAIVLRISIMVMINTLKKLFLQENLEN